MKKNISTLLLVVLIAFSCSNDTKYVGSWNIVSQELFSLIELGRGLPKLISPFQGLPPEEADLFDIQGLLNYFSADDLALTINKNGSFKLDFLDNSNDKPKVRKTINGKYEMESDSLFSIEVNDDVVVFHEKMQFISVNTDENMIVLNVKMSNQNYLLVFAKAGSMKYPVDWVETATKLPHKAAQIPQMPQQPSGQEKVGSFEMIRVKGGTFEMGDVMEDKEYETISDFLIGKYEVTLSDFLIGKYEVTFDEYDAFCTATGKWKPDDEGWGRGKRPVIHVRWEDAVAYCNWRSEKEGLTKVYTISGSTVTANWQASGYRLPTEAEWEYAAREGGKKVRFGNGKDIADPKEINFDGSADYKKPYSLVGEFSRRRTVPVGSLNSPNALGLADMSGNVEEWCWDWYGDYPAAAQTNPKGPSTGSLSTGSLRVHRGGSWHSIPAGVRVAERFDVTPGYRYGLIGFRLARNL